MTDLLNEFSFHSQEVNGDGVEGDGTEVGVVDDDSDGGCGDDRDALVIDSAETDDAAQADIGAKTAEESSNDLASVSRLINIDNPMRDFLEEKRGEVSDLEGGGEEGESENTSGSSAARKGTRSAYSAAPHKIPCPHCDRKFPWQSSLNRHILTHTGSKPYR